MFEGYAQSHDVLHPSCIPPELGVPDALGPLETIGQSFWAWTRLLNVINAFRTFVVYGIEVISQLMTVS